MNEVKNTTLMKFLLCICGLSLVAAVTMIVHLIYTANFQQFKVGDCVSFYKDISPWENYSVERIEEVGNRKYRTTRAYIEGSTGKVTIYKFGDETVTFKDQLIYDVVDCPKELK